MLIPLYMYIYICVYNILRVGAKEYPGLSSQDFVEHHIRGSMFYDIKRKLKAAESAHGISNRFGEDTVSDHRAQGWFFSFCTGDHDVEGSLLADLGQPLRRVKAAVLLLWLEYTKSCVLTPFSPGMRSRFCNNTTFY